VADEPLQIAVGDELAVMVGLGFTVTLTVVVPTQFPLAPVTV
jgi:hypothetical protein